MDGRDIVKEIVKESMQDFELRLKALEDAQNVPTPKSAQLVKGSKE